MATISAVRAAQPDRLAGVAADAGTTATTLQQQIDTGRYALASMRNGWEGTASDAASASVERTIAKQEKLVDALKGMQSALSSGGNQLTLTRTSIVENVARCEQVGFHVADDGTVSLRPGSHLAHLTEQSQVTAMKVQALAASNSLHLKTQLAGFDAQDQSLAQSLGASTAALNSIRGDQPQAPNDVAAAAFSPGAEPTGLIVDEHGLIIGYEEEPYDVDPDLDDDW